jgi:hypothetical protein
MEIERPEEEKLSSEVKNEKMEISFGVHKKKEKEKSLEKLYEKEMNKHFLEILKANDEIARKIHLQEYIKHCSQKKVKSQNII